MYSAKNSLKVFVSSYTAPTNQTTLDALEAGGVGFYDKAGNLATSGEGYIFFKKPNGQLVKSRKFDNFPGWNIQSYTAPVYERQNLAVDQAIAGELYQITILLYPHGMGGALVKHGNYVARQGQTTTDIAAGLVASINAALAREGEQYITVSNNTNTISIDQVPGDYKVGKKTYKPVRFKAALTYPESDAVNSTIIISENPGVGYGPAILEAEMFAKGFSEQFRENGWPNSYGLDDLLAKADGQYDVATFTLNINETVGNGNVNTTSDQYLVAFDTNGTTPPAAP